MHRLIPNCYYRLGTLLLAWSVAGALPAQDGEFPDVDVTEPSHDWYEEPIIWITSGVILLLLLWVARRRRTTSK
jgi:hypothetical protein